MTVVDDRVSSVLAAVASIVPTHGALAREKTPSGQKSVARLQATLPMKRKPSLQDSRLSPIRLSGRGITALLRSLS
jgi:hypothetical protein